MTDAELIETCLEVRKGILNGRGSQLMCAAVSWPLAGFLSAIHQVQCRCVEGDLGHCNHIWIELDDGRVLDPTADQFNEMFGLDYPPIYLGPALDIHPPLTQRNTQ